MECSVTDYQAFRESGDGHVLLDVREQDEWDLCHLEGAVHIPLRQIPQRLDELADAKGQPLVVMCHHGGRSRMAQQFLLENGFSDVRNLSGGIDQWSLQVDQAVPRY